MSIVSPAFAAFAVAAVLVYHLLPAERQRGWLLLASYAFYAFGAAPYLPLLIAVGLAVGAVATRVVPGCPHRAQWLLAGVVGCVGGLALLRFTLGTTPFAAPFVAMGAAFYVLQALSYLFDVSAGTLAPVSRFDLALYLAYFPKIVAGPIERAYVFLPRLARPQPVDDAAAARAGWLLATGLTRKLAIADPLAALIPANAFRIPTDFGAPVLAMALLSYAFVLYNDFAGYTAIVRGVSALFGIELSPNFAQPFFARRFADFWNRWHVSLTLWLRDYVYLPLSRAILRRDPRRWNVPNLVLPPLVAMLASGAWHGSGLHMVVWGGLHGVFLTVERIATLWRPPAPGASRPRWRDLTSMLIVFVFAALALVSFRLPMPLALDFWHRLLTVAPGPLPDVRWLLYCVPSLWLDWMQERHGECPFSHWSRVGRAVVLALALVACVLGSRAAAPAPFVYQGF